MWCFDNEGEVWRLSGEWDSDIVCIGVRVELGNEEEFRAELWYSESEVGH